MSHEIDNTEVQESPRYETLEPHQKQQRLRELAIGFFRLGAIAFGGPAAHIAMMNDEFVKRRKWFTEEKLLDLLGVTNLIPGPNSTELAIHIGYERAGLWGLAIAGSCFILPAMVIVWIIAALYARYQALPELGWLLYGIKPIIIAVVLQALWKLGKSAAKDLPTILAGLAVIVAFFLGVDEILLLVLAGVAVMLIRTWGRAGSTTTSALMLPIPSLLAQVGGGAGTSPSPNWIQVFLFFLKIGSVLYGSGYVLLAFLQRELVERTQWLTSQQLLDAIAVGQLTPGPVFTTATFVGYLLAGNVGAIAGTIGIFLPAFVLVAIINPWVPKLRQSPWASGFLDGVNAASLGLMAVVTWQLGQAAIIDWWTIGIVVIGAIALFYYKVNSAWLVIAGGVLGLCGQLLNLGSPQ
ncbi:chromate transporter [Oscillatoria sp. FACHB-1407]|uniref:chromate transporter n=1 Tax=Oscillatoria sp. FACHB-1407 TaxID=2692847 RepID=UPI0016836618|nr:chromate transporter [Oscillatoria sp. FACHB-1407]MBD2461005.1 chromate transporter [Oscillatoria sp. FACHB-1407]